MGMEPSDIVVPRYYYWRLYRTAIYVLALAPILFCCVWAYSIVQANGVQRLKITTDAEIAREQMRAQHPDPTATSVLTAESALPLLQKFLEKQDASGASAPVAATQHLVDAMGETGMLAASSVKALGPDLVKLAAEETIKGSREIAVKGASALFDRIFKSDSEKKPESPADASKKGDSMGDRTPSAMATVEVTINEAPNPHTNPQLPSGPGTRPPISDPKPPVSNPAPKPKQTVDCHAIAK